MQRLTPDNKTRAFRMTADIHERGQIRDFRPTLITLIPTVLPTIIPTTILALLFLALLFLALLFLALFAG